jgi:hypothetical protein
MLNKLFLTSLLAFFPVQLQMGAGMVRARATPPCFV